MAVDYLNILLGLLVKLEMWGWSYTVDVKRRRRSRCRRNHCGCGHRRDGRLVVILI